MIKTAGVVIVVGALAGAWLTGCSSTHRFSLKMRWANDPELNHLWRYSTTEEHVCLRYVEEPAFFECFSGTGIGERLNGFKKEEVRVDFEGRCRGQVLVSYDIVAIDGRSVGTVDHQIGGETGARKGDYPFYDACL